MGHQFANEVFIWPTSRAIFWPSQADKVYGRGAKQICSVRLLISVFTERSGEAGGWERVWNCFLTICGFEISSPWPQTENREQVVNSYVRDSVPYAISRAFCCTENRSRTHWHMTPAFLRLVAGMQCPAESAKKKNSPARRTSSCIACASAGQQISLQQGTNDFLQDCSGSSLSTEKEKLLKRMQLLLIGSSYLAFYPDERGSAKCQINVDRFGDQLLWDGSVGAPWPASLTAQPLKVWWREPCRSIT